MDTTIKNPKNKAAEFVLTIAANFTADPLEEFLRFWITRLGLRARVEFSGYNQILQELIDPNSLMASREAGSQFRPDSSRGLGTRSARRRSHRSSP